MSRLLRTSKQQKEPPKKSKKHRYISFRIGAEIFAIDILKVHEVLSYRPLTTMPAMPDVIIGVLDYKGSVVPIMDMRRRFNLPSVEYTKFNVILIVDVGGRIMGALVDSVTDVISVDVDTIQAPPRFYETVKNEYIKGMIKSEDESFTILLDMDKILTQEEIRAAEVGEH